jgi:hypothetical protein
VSARARAVAEIAGLVVWLLVFVRLENALGRDAAAATANALALQSAERALHLDVEHAANAWLAGLEPLGRLAMWVYRLYYLAVVGVLGWVYVRHAEVYPRVRRAMVAMTVLVLPVYWAVPMSPPRFAQPGIVDVVARYDVFAAAPASHYTAMPSLHVGWALWCAYAVWSARPRLGPLAWLFPVLMAAVVLGTGNHYVLDIAGSVVLLAASVAAAALCGRAKSVLSTGRKLDHPEGPVAP